MSGSLGALVGSANAQLSSSKLVWGLAAIVASLGSRFVIGDLTPVQQGVMSSKVVRRVVVFAMVFLPTRDVLLSACLTVIILTLLDGLLNERSRFCIMPMCRTPGQASLPVAHRMMSMATAIRPGQGQSQTRVHNIQAADGDADDDVDALLFR